MVAPVLPALTIADALASRTSSAARTSDESFLRRTPWAASSFMVMTSVQANRSRPIVSPTCSGGPTSRTAMSSSSRARAARPQSHLVRGRLPSRRRRRAVCQRPGVGRCADRSTQSTSTAWRPLYHPQFGQTTWGPCGRAVRAGRARRALQHPGGRTTAPALAFEVFFFGTAIVISRFREVRRHTARQPRGVPAWSAQVPSRACSTGRSTSRDDLSTSSVAHGDRRGARRCRPRRCGPPALRAQPRTVGQAEGASGSSRTMASRIIGPRSSWSSPIS